MAARHRERHRTDRIGWLRAAVLGANDGIVSTASLVLGVAAAGATHSNVMIAGIAGLVAGAMSMAAGEYVSVRSQSGFRAGRARHGTRGARGGRPGERRELTAIYVGRGVDPALAKQVAEQLMAHDALGAHARDELGISETSVRGRSRRRLRRRPASRLAPRCRCWRSPLVPAIGPDPCRLRDVAGVPRDPRRPGSARGRCKRDDGRHARHVLGRACHGDDGRRRCLVRNSRVTMQTQSSTERSTVH